MDKGRGGITLIALVITIVILLILSAVVINMALGNGGLAQKAKEATENYKLAEQAEMESIAEIEEELNNLDYGGGEGGGRWWSEATQMLLFQVDIQHHK